jgi:hypothetical protein
VDFGLRIQSAGSGGDFPASATMLSRSSVQVMCDADPVATLVKQSQPPYICNLTFMNEDAARPLILQAQVLTHRRVSQQHYVLVFLFREVDEQQEEELLQLLREVVPPHIA